MDAILSVDRLVFKNPIDDDFAVEELTLVSPSALKRARSLQGRIGDQGAVTKISFSDGAWFVEATFGSLSDRCYSCFGNVTVHGKSHATFLDEPFEDAPLFIRVTRPRYICTSCNKTLTPVVAGLNEHQRLTERLVAHVARVVGEFPSLRALAASVGAQPRTISKVLQHVADLARARTVSPNQLGIHQLYVSKLRHLAVTNLRTATFADFLPKSNQQLSVLTDYIGSSTTRNLAEVIAVPIDTEIARIVANANSKAQLIFSLNSVQDVAAKTLTRHATIYSRKGKKGSISKAASSRVLSLRLSELTEDDARAREAGHVADNPFWKLFDAKEELLSALESCKSETWDRAVYKWAGAIDATTRMAFSGLINELVAMKSFGAFLSIDSALSKLEMSVRRLQNYFQRPGTAFSAEMIGALLLATSGYQVPAPKTIGVKGSSLAWVEQLREGGHIGLPPIFGSDIDALLVWFSTKTKRRSLSYLDLFG